MSVRQSEEVADGVSEGESGDVGRLDVAGEADGEVSGADEEALGSEGAAVSDEVRGGVVADVAESVGGPGAWERLVVGESADVCGIVEGVGVEERFVESVDGVEERGVVSGDGACGHAAVEGGDAGVSDGGAGHFGGEFAQVSLAWNKVRYARVHSHVGSEAKLVLEVQGGGDFIVEELWEGASVGSREGVSDEPGEGDGMVGVSGAGFPGGCHVGDEAAAGVPVGELVVGLGPGEVLESGAVGEEVPEEDVLLAVRGELGPDVGDARGVGEGAALDEAVGEGGEDALADGEDGEEGVLADGASALGVGEAGDKGGGGPTVLVEGQLQSEFRAVRDGLVQESLELGDE